MAMRSRRAMSYRARGGGAPSGAEWRECANAVWCNGWLDTCQRVARVVLIGPIRVVKRDACERGVLYNVNVNIKGSTRREKLNVGGRGDVENAFANGAFGLRVLRLDDERVGGFGECARRVPDNERTLR